MRWLSRNGALKRANGQSITEYLLISAALTFALFTPVAQFGGMSVAQLLSDAVRRFFKVFVYFISLP